MLLRHPINKQQQTTTTNMLSPIKFLKPEEDIPGSFIHRGRRVIRVGCGNPKKKKNIDNSVVIK